MPEFVVATEESVRGTYIVEADSPEAARREFEARVRTAGHQIAYEAYDVQVRHVTPLDPAATPEGGEDAR